MIDKIIERLETEIKEIRLESRSEIYGTIKIMAYEKAIDIVKQVAEEHKGGWIKCSDRLPKKSNETYLCTVDNPYDGITLDFVRYDHFANGNFWMRGCHKEVIAWQPLPQPYKEG